LSRLNGLVAKNIDLLLNDRTSICIRDLSSDNAATNEREVDVFDILIFSDEDGLFSYFFYIGRQKSRSRRRDLISSRRNVRDAIAAILIRRGP